MLSRNKGNITDQFALGNTSHPFFSLQSCSAFLFFYSPFSKGNWKIVLLMGYKFLFPVNSQTLFKRVLHIYVSLIWKCCMYMVKKEVNCNYKTASVLFP